MHQHPYIDTKYYKAACRDLIGHNITNIQNNIRLKKPANCKLLTIDKLSSKIRDCLVHANMHSRICHSSRSFYSRFLPIRPKKSRNFVHFQVILSLKEHIPILLKKPKKLYVNNTILRCQSKSNRYECVTDGCNFAITRNIRHNILHYDSFTPHISEACIKPNWKHELIYDMIKNELYKNVLAEQSPMITTPRHHYNQIITKYQYQIPFLDLSRFPSYERIHKTIHNYKLIKHKLTSIDMKDFMDNKFREVIARYCSSAWARELLLSKLRYNVKDEDFIFTNSDLLWIFFQSLAIGADGTFNIRPQFVDWRKGAGRFTRHSQVFKVYAFYEYPTTNGLRVLKSYLIAIALLKNKTKESYQWVYNTLLQWGKDLNYINKKKFTQYMSDFELPQRQGLSAALVEVCITDVRISGEEYHQKKAIYKNIVAKHLGPYFTKRKDSKKYDVIFRKHVELIYNLCHTPIKYVKEYAKIICRSLWLYVTRKYKREICKHFLNFIVYILFGWCELTKIEIRKCLRLSPNSNYGKYLSSLRPRKVEIIKRWNLHGLDLRNNNSIEVNNKHDRVQMGYYPIIDNFIINFFDKFAETIRHYNSHREQPVLPSTQPKYLIEKAEILKKYKNKELTFEEFKMFSALLTKNKYRNKIHKYFFDENAISDEFNYQDFNDMINNQDQLSISPISIDILLNDESVSSDNEHEEWEDYRQGGFLQETVAPTPAPIPQINSINQRDSTIDDYYSQISDNALLSEPPRKKRKKYHLRPRNNAPKLINVSYDTADSDVYNNNVEQKIEYDQMQILKEKYNHQLDCIQATTSMQQFRDFQNMIDEAHDLYDWKNALQCIQNHRASLTTSSMFAQQNLCNDLSSSDTSYVSDYIQNQESDYMDKLICIDNQLYLQIKTAKNPILQKVITPDKPPIPYSHIPSLIPFSK